MQECVPRDCECDPRPAARSPGAVKRRVGRVGRVSRVGRVAGVGRVRRVRRVRARHAAQHVLPVRVLVEPPLRHEQRRDSARREAHGGRARRDAAAPALRARVVQHLQARHRLPNAFCNTTTHIHHVIIAAQYYESVSDEHVSSHPSDLVSSRTDSIHLHLGYTATHGTRDTDHFDHPACRHSLQFKIHLSSKRGKSSHIVYYTSCSPILIMSSKHI